MARGAVPVRRHQARRPAPGGGGDITLFKAMGMGLSDLAIAALAYRRASAADGAPRTVPLTAAAPIRWSRSAA